MGHQLKGCNKNFPEDKNKIYAIKKAGTLGKKNTGVMNTVVEGTPGYDASAALSVTISGLEHDQYKRFLGVYGEDLVELFNIGEEEEFDEENSGFAFDFCKVGDVSLVDIEGEWTLSSWTSVSDVAKVGGATFAESEWKKQGQKSRPTKNMIMPARQHALETASPACPKVLW